MISNEANDLLLRPFQFGKLRLKNRILRSSISGRFDNYDGSGTYVRINWEEKFARGGVGAIISSFVPVHTRGRILPHYAMINHDGTIPFWKAVGERVHQYKDENGIECKYILQLSHSGRQQDQGGVENRPFRAQSSTSRTEPLHGFLCQSMTQDEIRYVVQCFAEGARRAKAAGLDGVETHSANGYLINQFLSSAINNRTDRYGGSIEARGQFLVEILRAIRRAVGDDFQVQAKISAVEHDGIVPWPLAGGLFSWPKAGNTLEESLTLCQMLEKEGVDAIHVSSGAMFPHPRNPAGDFPFEHAVDWYDGLLSSGIHTLRNYFLFRYRLLRPIFRWAWFRKQGSHKPEGINVADALAIKKAVKVPVIVTGGFQTASVMARVIRDGCADAVSIARPLIANNDLVQIFASGRDTPERPCTYCNKCLLNDVENPLGCYELCRYKDYAEMMEQAMSVFYPSPLGNTAPPYAGLIADEPSGQPPVPLKTPVGQAAGPCKKYQD